MCSYVVDEVDLLDFDDLNINDKEEEEQEEEEEEEEEDEEDDDQEGGGDDSEDEAMKDFNSQSHNSALAVGYSFFL